MSSDTQNSLTAALSQYSIDLPSDQVDVIGRYCEQLWDHNSRHNLTRHTDFDTFVARDVADSIELSSLLKAGEWILDIGSGGGVPGILLAILKPDLGRVVLSEFVTKKADCLQQMVDALDLKIEVVTERAENILIASQFDVVTARAVGPLRKMLPWFEACWGQYQRMLLIKGPRWVEEKEAADELGLTEGLSIEKVHEYLMPGRDSQSVVLELKLADQ